MSYFMLNGNQYGGNGASISALTAAQYTSLSPSAKNNGNLYLVDGREGIVNPITSITIGQTIENIYVCNNEVTQDGAGIISHYYGGMQIGNNFWIATKIDVTDYSSIMYDLELGTCYSPSATWNYTIGLMSAIPSGYYYANDTTNYIIKKQYDTTNSSYTQEELDVSNLTGEYYIAMVAHGWNATLQNIKLTSEIATLNKVYYKNIEYANTGVDADGIMQRDILFENTGTTNPATISLLHPLSDYDEVLFQLGSTGYDAIFSMEYDVADLSIGDTIGAGGTSGVFVWYYYTNASTLTYRVDSGGNVYISKIIGKKYGCYSGNITTYGYAVPSVKGHNGDTYIMLDETNTKIATYLYMINQWIPIEITGDFYSIELIQTRRNSTTEDVYTATEKCTVICINQNMNGEASTKTLTSPITTTGIIIDTNSYSTNWNNPNRNQTTDIAIIRLNENDTVSLSNTYEGNYTTQMHLVLKLREYVSATQLTRNIYVAKADNNISSEQTYSTLTAGKYLSLCFQTSGTGGGTQYATIKTTDNKAITTILSADTNESISLALSEHPNTITFDWGSLTNYATKGYAVYKIN